MVPPLPRPGTHQLPASMQSHISYVPFVDEGYPLFAAFAKAWLKANYPVISVACE